MDPLQRKSLPNNAISVTPSDSVDIYGEGVALFIGTGGDVRVEMEGGTVITFSNVADGTFLPILVNKVYSTSTTATDIIALY